MKFVRRLMVLAAALILAACGGGDDTAATVPASAGEAQIGPAGGNVEALLEGGTTLRLEVPAGAISAPVTLRIEPVAAQPGDSGAFQITPSGIALLKPVALVLTGAASLPVDTLLLHRIDGELRPLSAAIGPARQTRVEVEHLGIAPLVQAATREKPANVGTDPYLLQLGQLSTAQQLAALDQAIATTTGGAGTIANAIATNQVLAAVVGGVNPAEPQLRDAALLWRQFLCAQRAFAVSALATFNGSDAPTFRQLARDALIWGQLAQSFAASAAQLQPPVATCDGAPADYKQPVRDKVAQFIPAVQQALGLLDVAYIGVGADFDQLLDTRLPELMQLEEALQFFDLGGSFIATIGQQALRLRLSAYAQCEHDGTQARQLKLLQRLLNDLTLRGAAGYDEDVLHTDIHFCGMNMFAQPLDGGGQATVALALLAERLRSVNAQFQFVDPPAVRKTLVLAGAQTLRLRRAFAPLRALACPPGFSRNAEQLLFEAGPPGGALTEIGRLTPSATDTYLAPPLVQDFDAANLAVLRNPATDETLLRVRREGGLCGGAFPFLPPHPVLAELTLHFAVLAVATLSLPDATVGAAYSTTLAASPAAGTRTWSVTGLPPGLSLDAATGVISGVPNQAGARNVLVTVTTATGSSASKQLALNVIDAVAVAGLYVGTRTDETPGNTFGNVAADSRFVRQSGTRIAVSLRSQGVDRGFGQVFELAQDGTLTYLGDATTRTGFEFQPSPPSDSAIGTLLNNRLQYVDTIFNSDGSVGDRFRYDLVRQ